MPAELDHAVTKPNLFSFATSELSQDAFICWLLEWADPRCEEADGALHQIGRTALKKLLESCRLPQPVVVTSVDIRKQYKKIDILVVVNDSIALIIEDKTDTKNHSGQLQRYRDTVEADFRDHRIGAVYLKTGDQHSYDDIRDAGYSCFLRRDLLDVLQVGDRLNVQNSIFRDFYEHLQRVEDRVRDYRRLPVSDWHQDCWTGFFIELRERLGDGKWGYVPNPSGGFMGFWWHRIEDAYLQLENDRLCFKIKTEDEAQRTTQWKAWNKRLMDGSRMSSLPIVRPARRQNGTSMSVAILDGDYRQHDAEGVIDMVETVDFLRSAGALLAQAVADRNEPPQ